MGLIAHLMEISIKLKGHKFEGFECFQIPESAAELWSSCGSWMHFSLSATEDVGVTERQLVAVISCSSGGGGLRPGGSLSAEAVSLTLTVSLICCASLV